MKAAAKPLFDAELSRTTLLSLQIIARPRRTHHAKDFAHLDCREVAKPEKELSTSVDEGVTAADKH